MNHHARRARNTLIAGLAGLTMLCAMPGEAGAASIAASALKAKYEALGEQLSNNAFKRPLTLLSSETERTLSGDIHGVIDSPFAAFGEAMGSAERWCDVMILHLNTKYCKVAGGAAQPLLTVYVGKKDYQELRDANRVDFNYRLASASPEYLDVRLQATQGPMGTSNYHIALEAIPVGPGKTFLHLRYSYDYGFAARLAMQAYLGTLGRSKVGFTTTASAGGGSAGHIGGMRGVIERNTMRYFLAIEAYLGVSDGSPSEQTEKRLRAWYAATDRYPRQLHEVDRDAYLQMKRRELARQLTG